jgi:hypothetical protein
MEITNVPEMHARAALCALTSHHLRTGPPSDFAWLGEHLARAISSSLIDGGVHPPRAPLEAEASSAGAVGAGADCAPAYAALSGRVDAALGTVTQEMDSLRTAIDMCSSASAEACARVDAAAQSQGSASLELDALRQHVTSLAAEQHNIGASLHSARLELLDMQDDIGTDESQPVPHVRFQEIEARLGSVVLNVGTLSRSFGDSTYRQGVINQALQVQMGALL